MAITTATTAKGGSQGGLRCACSSCAQTDPSDK